MRSTAPLLGLFALHACGGAEAQRRSPRPVIVELTTEAVAAPVEEAPTPELPPWEQLLHREAVFRGALTGAQCVASERAFVLVSGDDGSDAEALAKRAGCRILGEVQHREVRLCCPETFEAPRRSRNGSGQSCEVAEQEYVDDKLSEAGDQDERPSAGLYGALLNRGSYLKPCSVPDWMAVDICAAVQNGVVKGISVRTFPASIAIGDCIADEVRKVEFPTHEKMDITITKFAADE